MKHQLRVIRMIIFFYNERSNNMYAYFCYTKQLITASLRQKAVIISDCNHKICEINISYHISYHRVQSHYIPLPIFYRRWIENRIECSIYIHSKSCFVWPKSFRIQFDEKGRNANHIHTLYFLDYHTYRYLENRLQCIFCNVFV